MKKVGGLHSLFYMIRQHHLGLAARISIQPSQLRSSLTAPITAYSRGKLQAISPD